MKIFSLLFIVSCCPLLAVAQNNNSKNDHIEVETTRIKANKELPKVLYVVPWKEMEKTSNTDQKLVLHDFFGDLYDPVLPSRTDHATTLNPSSDNTK